MMRRPCAPRSRDQMVFFHPPLLPLHLRRVGSGRTGRGRGGGRKCAVLRRSAQPLRRRCVFPGHIFTPAASSLPVCPSSGYRCVSDFTPYIWFTLNLLCLCASAVFLQNDGSLMSKAIFLCLSAPRVDPVNTELFNYSHGYIYNSGSEP